MCVRQRQRQSKSKSRRGTEGEEQCREDWIALVPLLTIFPILKLPIVRR